MLRKLPTKLPLSIELVVDAQRFAGALRDNSQ